MRKLLSTTAIIAFAAAPLAAATATEPTPITDAVEGSDITISDLLNRDVYIMTGTDSSVGWADWTDVPANFERSGEIEDLLLNKDGQITTAVLGKGGVLDIGEKEVQVDIGKFGLVKNAEDNGDFYIVYTGAPSELERAAPYRGLGEQIPAALNTRADTNAASPGKSVGENTRVVEDTSKGQVRGASNVDNSSMQMEMEAAGQDLMGYASHQTESGGAEPRWTTTSAKRAQIESAARGDYFGAAPTMEQAGLTTVSADSVSLDDLEWVPVYTQNGDRIGKIGDLTLDDSGKISEAIVDMGGFLGVGQKPVAVPFDKMTLKRDPNGDALRAYIQMSEPAIEKLRTQASSS